MVLGLHAFARTHKHTQNILHPFVCGRLCDFTVLSFGNSDAPCKTTGGGWQVANDAKGANASPPPPAA